MSVVGYVYAADTWCEDCIVGAIQCRTSMVLESVPNTLTEWAEVLGIDRDDEYSYDTDEFPKVILSSHEGFDSCANCHTLLDTSWGSEEVIRAADILESYVSSYWHDTPRNAEFADEVCEQLSWCITASREDRIRQVFEFVREQEKDDAE